MIAIRTSTICYTLVAGALALTPIVSRDPHVPTAEAPDVRAFYATRDPSLAPSVQAWLTEPREGVIDAGAVSEVLELSRSAQLAACLSLDPHGGDVDVHVDQTGALRTTTSTASNPDVAECLETVVSSLAIRDGHADIDLSYANGNVIRR